MHSRADKDEIFFLSIYIVQLKVITLYYRPTNGIPKNYEE